MNKYLSLIKDTRKYLEQLNQNTLSLNPEYRFIQKKSLPTPTPITTPVKTPLVLDKKEEKVSAPLKEKKSFPKEPLLQKMCKPELKNTLEDIKKDIQKIAKDFWFVEKIPSDDQAKRIAFSYKYKNQAAPISILLFEEKKEHIHLLQQIAQALSHYFMPANTIQAASLEKEKKWASFLSAPHLKLIIASDYSIWQQKELMRFYREYPHKSENFLENTPLFMLPDLTLYFKDPILKRSLWKALCQKIDLLPQ